MGFISFVGVCYLKYNICCQNKDNVHIGKDLGNPFSVGWYIPSFIPLNKGNFTFLWKYKILKIVTFLKINAFEWKNFVKFEVLILPKFEWTHENAKMSFESKKIFSFHLNQNLL